MAKPAAPAAVATPAADPSTFSLQESIEAQIQKVLTKGQRFARFDQIRQRHFWSSYLFTPGAGGVINAAPYEIFKVTPGFIGQGYPVPLTTRETNWLGNGRVPDNQNFVITEIGVTIKRPPATPQLETIEGVLVNTPGQPFTNPPSNGIAAAIPPATVALINGLAPVNPMDAQAILYGMVLEMSFLTNNVPIGLCADFSQSGGMYGFTTNPYYLSSFSMGWMGDTGTAHPGGAFPAGDPTNGIPAAAFRRKLEIPILLQHGEQMGMRLNAPRPIACQNLANGGSGWFEVRVDWWATESFVEQS
jgi:hypothetical protein